MFTCVMGCVCISVLCVMFVAYKCVYLASCIASMLRSCLDEGHTSQNAVLQFIGMGNAYHHYSHVTCALEFYCSHDNYIDAVI